MINEFKLQELKKTLDLLKSSPLFNLSLSSRELFHSNFLYWVALNYKNEFGKMFSEYIKKQPSNYTINNPQREKNHIDLSFSYINGQVVIIENKVKSLVYKEQLTRYSKKNDENNNYILLCLSKPLLIESNLEFKKTESPWLLLSYKELVIKLRDLGDNIYDNNYHKDIINDYCLFINCLIEIDKLCETSEDDKFNFHDIKKDEIYNSLFESQVRLHDFYLKKKYELFAYLVFSKLKSHGKNIIDFGNSMIWENEIPIIYIEYGMTRGCGLMSLKYLIDYNLALGIQIQGEHYRMFIDNAKYKITEESLNKIDNKLWFDFSKNFPSHDIYPKSPKIFNKYGSSFFYKSVKLGSLISIKEIVKILISEVELIEKNKQEIIHLLKLN
jgi:hypothetical protein